MKKTTILAVLGCAVIATPALAQDEKAFDGPRAEVLAGYDRFDLDIDGIEADGNSEDVFYGAAIGYDFQSTGLLFGAEAEIASSGNGGEIDITETVDGSVYDGTISLEDGVNWYVGGRVGSVLGSNLFYFKAGFAHTTLDLDVEGTVDGEPGSESADFNFSGLRLGGGVERSFGNAYGKIEYRYTAYSDGDVEFEGESLDLVELGEYDLNRHQIVAGVGFRF